MSRELKKVPSQNEALIAHVPEFDALRGIAIFMVFFSHSTTILPNREALGWINHLFSFGGTGVQLFYIVSAVTLLRSHAQRRTQSGDPILYFYLRRLFRIVPAFYIVSIIVSLLSSQVRSLGEVSTHMLLVHGFWERWSNSILGVEWSISCEVLFYAFAPFLFFSASNDFGRKVLRIVFVATLLLSYLMINAGFYLYNPLIHFFTFVMAILWFSAETSFLKKGAKPVLSVLILMFLCFFHKKFDWMMSTRETPLLWGIGFCAFVTVVLNGGHLVKTIFVNPFWIKLGKWSYSFYLVHNVIIIFFRQVLIPRFDLEAYLYRTYALATCLSFGVSFVISGFLFNYVEKTGLTLGKKVIKWIEKANNRSLNSALNEER